MPGHQRRAQKILKSGKSIVITSVGLALCSAACAQASEADTDIDIDQPMFSFGGYGTAGVAHSSESRADYTSYFLKPSGAGYSRSWSADVDSRLGAQVSANINPQLSAVVQIVSEQRYDNTYTPILEWANVKYKVTPDLSIRVGRIALSTFLAADYRKVGYAIPWVRTPVEVYGMVPISNSDGVDVSYRLYAGNLTNTLKASYGKSDVKFAGDNIAQVKNMWGVSNTVEHGAASVRFSYLQSSLNVDYAQPFFNAFRQFGAQGVSLADTYDVDNKAITVISLGGSYDPGKWFAMAEWARSHTRSIFGDKTAWYVSSGYRFGRFTPYITYAQVKANSRTYDPGLNTAMLPPASAGVAMSLNASLNSLLEAIPVQKTISIGGRWDLMKNVALKLQYDHIRLGAGSQGTLIQRQSDFRTGGKVNVVSAVVDFVF